MLDDTNAEVRSSILNTLRQLGESGVVSIWEHVVAKLEDEDKNCRRAALVLLRHGIKSFDDASDAELAQRIQPVLLRITDDDEFVSKLARWLLTRDTFQRCQRGSADVFEKMALDLVSMLRHAKPHVRCHAIEVLGYVIWLMSSGSCRTQDPGYCLKRVAPVTVGQLQKGELLKVVPKILPCLNDSEESVRDAAMEVVGDLGKEAVIELMPCSELAQRLMAPMAAQLEDGSDVVRMLACTSLEKSRLDAEHHEQAVLRLTSDRHWAVRCASLGTVARLGRAAVVLQVNWENLMQVPHPRCHANPRPFFKSRIALACRMPTVTCATKRLRKSPNCVWLECLECSGRFLNRSCRLMKENLQTTHGSLPS